MSDITTITAAIGGVKTALDIVKTLYDLDVATQQAELRAKLVELREALTDAKGALIDSQELLREKDSEIARLHGALAFKGKLVRHVNAYYETNEEGEPAGIAYCPRCEDVDHRAIPMIKNGNRTMCCPECKTAIPFQRTPEERRKEGR